MVRRRMVILGFMALTLLVLFVVVITRPAAAQDASRDAAEGYRLASQWCSSCHMIEPGAGASDVAPSFQQSADNPGKTPAHLRAWLSASHEDMPDFNLSCPEIAALIAYIESLRGE